MQYLITIYSKETDSPAPPAIQRQIIEAYFAYNANLKAAGVFLGGEALQPTATATTITETDGKSIVTDGPFAETTEALGGFYLIDCENLDDAIGWAKQCPGCKYGKVEVRPLLVLPKMN